MEAGVFALNSFWNIHSDVAHEFLMRAARLQPLCNNANIILFLSLPFFFLFMTSCLALFIVSRRLDVFFFLCPPPHLSFCLSLSWTTCFGHTANLLAI